MEKKEIVLDQEKQAPIKKYWDEFSSLYQNKIEMSTLQGFMALALHTKAY